MGWTEVDNTETVTLRNFSAGSWFNYPNDQIPGTLDGSQPIGFVRASNLVWLNNRLSKMFGYDQIQSADLNGKIKSIFFAASLSTPNLLGTAGTAIYRGLQLAAPTDITGAVVLTADTIVKWVDWKFGSTAYAIGVSSNNAPWKVANAGNATALGGSHGSTSSPGIAAWQNSLWLVAGTPSTLKFSSLGDPEVWAANDNYVFNADITDVKPFGNMLVVFKKTSIGVLYGTNNRQLTKVDNFVVGIGHDSGFNEAVPGKLGNKDVLFFINKNGVYVFDGTNSVSKISGSLDYVFNPPFDLGGAVGQPMFDLSITTNFTMTFIPDWSWLLLFYNDTLGAGKSFFILDLNYTKQTGPASLAAAAWWIEGSAGRFGGATYSPRRFSLAYPEIYLWGPNNRVCLLNPALDTRKESVSAAAENYTCSGKTKLFDLGGEYLLQEVNLEQAFYTADGTALRSGVDFNRGNDDDTTVLGLITFAFSADRPFFWNNVDSNLAGDNPINFGRWLNFYLFGDTTSKLFAVEGISATISSFGPDPNVGNTGN